MGVIVRSNYCATCTPDKQIVGWYKRISFPQITDGSSNTMVLGEKRLRPSQYDTNPISSPGTMTGAGRKAGTLTRCGPQFV